jgi:hypothetical protein
MLGYVFRALLIKVFILAKFLLNGSEVYPLSVFFSTIEL